MSDVLILKVTISVRQSFTSSGHRVDVGQSRYNDSNSNIATYTTMFKNQRMTVSPMNVVSDDMIHQEDGHSTVNYTLALTVRKLAARLS